MFLFPNYRTDCCHLNNGGDLEFLPLYYLSLPISSSTETNTLCLSLLLLSKGWGMRGKEGIEDDIER